MFVDSVTIQIEAGRGGDGCMSFRREKFIPRGGPDGGDGGDGGSVIIVATPGVDSLAALSGRRHWKAPSGQPGAGAGCHGRNAEDLTIQVPPGTLVIDAEHGHVLKDLAAPGRERRGRARRQGGQRQHPLQKRQPTAPRDNSLPAAKRESRLLKLELKVIADVGADRQTQRRQEHAAQPLVAGPAARSPTIRLPPSIPTWASCRPAPTARS